MKTIVLRFLLVLTLILLVMHQSNAIESIDNEKKLLIMEDRNYNININFHNDQSPLNTPPCLDLYNIQNDNRKSIFDWNVELQSSNVYRDTSTEVPSTITINELPSQSSSSVEDTGTQYPEQETSQNYVETSTTTEIINNETNESEPNLEELWARGMEHEDNMDPVVEESTDQQTSPIIDESISTMATDITSRSANQQEQSIPLINNLVLPSQISSTETSQNTSTYTEIHPPADVIPYGYFRHPVASKIRLRYERELVTNEMSSKMSHIKDCFGERPILFGPDTLFADHCVEISLLSMTPDNKAIFSYHTFYNANMPDAKKFSNPIYLQPHQLDISDGYIELDLIIAKKCQQHLLCDDKSDKQYHWTKNPKCTIKHYPSGKEESIYMTTRQLKKAYHLDNMRIGVRRVQLQSDGISYLADQNSSAIFSNCFIGVDSNDSPATWDFNEHKLKILDMKIINEDVSLNQNNVSIIKFVLQLPETYHCTLESGCKRLEAKLITNENLSENYKIASENGTQNPTYFAVNIGPINLRLTIIKESSSDQQQIQNGLRLEPLSEQVDSTAFNHFRVQFCLQDVGTNDSSRRTPYPYSIVQSMALIDINASENNEIQQSDTMICEMTGKRRNDDENTVGTLPITKYFKKTNE